MPLVCRVAVLAFMGAGAALFCGISHGANRPGPVGEDGEWRMPAKDFAGTRFSALADITPQKAPSLRPVWTFSTGVLGGHEGQPLVVDGVMYVVTPWPNVLYAFDLSKEGYPLKWKYRPDVSPNAIGVSCCDTVNRGVAYGDGNNDPQNLAIPQGKILRIAHLGYYDATDTLGLLATLEIVLRRLGHRFDLGAGLAAAETEYLSLTNG